MKQTKYRYYAVLIRPMRLDSAVDKFDTYREALHAMLAFNNDVKRGDDGFIALAPVLVTETESGVLTIDEFK